MTNEDTSHERISGSLDGHSPAGAELANKTNDPAETVQSVSENLATIPPVDGKVAIHAQAISAELLSRVSDAVTRAEANHQRVATVVQYQDISVNQETSTDITAFLAGMHATSIHDSPAAEFVIRAARDPKVALNLLPHISADEAAEGRRGMYVVGDPESEPTDGMHTLSLPSQIPGLQIVAEVGRDTCRFMLAINATEQEFPAVVTTEDNTPGLRGMREVAVSDAQAAVNRAAPTERLAPTVEAALERYNIHMGDEVAVRRRVRNEDGEYAEPRQEYLDLDWSVMGPALDDDGQPKYRDSQPLVWVGKTNDGSHAKGGPDDAMRREVTPLELAEYQAGVQFPDDIDALLTRITEYAPNADMSRWELAERSRTKPGRVTVSRRPIIGSAVKEFEVHEFTPAQLSRMLNKVKESTKPQRGILGRLGLRRQ